MQRAHTAKNKMMDCLARRPHSEQELREKIALEDFPADEVDAAIAYARARKWLRTDEEALQEVVESLHKKQKGIHFINSKLEQKGLPLLAEDEEQELAKARQALHAKFRTAAGEDIPPAERAKRARFLAGRGYSEEIITQLIGFEAE